MAITSEKHGSAAPKPPVAGQNVAGALLAEIRGLREDMTRQKVTLRDQWWTGARLGLGFCVAWAVIVASFYIAVSILAMAGLAVGDALNLPR